VSRLSFRGRLFAVLLLVSAVPVGLMAYAGYVTLRTTDLGIEGRSELERIEASYQELNRSLTGVPMAPAADAARLEHERALRDFGTKFRRVRGVQRELPSQLGWVLGVAALVLLFTVAAVGTTLSRQLAAPLDEVVEWTGRIKRREPLPDDTDRSRGIPEFAELRAALRDLASSLEQGRRAELEAERLRTFGEVARRVAHEMKNPLTPIRLAVLQLRRGATPDTAELLEVIGAESARLEAMAREFAQLGRLPETVPSPVDLRELLGEMLAATVPETVARDFITAEGDFVVEAQYDPLRRAFSNILRNAVEACDGAGRVGVTLSREAGAIEVRIADSGPGIPPEKRDLVFQPYFTDKRDGTGLGLAIVRQTVEQHGGTITVTETPGGGATFSVRLPA
jgi:signal transduction histidine kinase